MEIVFVEFCICLFGLLAITMGLHRTYCFVRSHRSSRQENKEHEFKTRERERGRKSISSGRTSHILYTLKLLEWKLEKLLCFNFLLIPNSPPFLKLSNAFHCRNSALWMCVHRGYSFYLVDLLIGAKTFIRNWCR